jgi:hypothetical protein
VLNVALRIEWAKSKARATRWHEEVMLLEEEMCRAIAYGGWSADWWQRQAELRSQLDPILGGADAYLAEGLRMYAAEHTHLELSLVSQLNNKFRDIHERARTVLADLDNGSVTELTAQTAIHVELELEMDLGDDEEHF